MKSSTSLLCRSSSRSESCTTFSARVTASSPISLRSESSSWWRSVASRAQLASRISSARRVPSLRASSMICPRAAGPPHDLPALFLRLLAKPCGLAAGLRERLLQLFPRGLEAGLGLLGVLELLADRLLALLDPAGDGRQDLLPDDPENEPEDDPLEDERAVRDEEVVGLLTLSGSQDDGMHAPSAHLPSTKANSAAKARLMKYAASTRPTVRKN